MHRGAVTAVIDTREELVDALTEAAELEHGLLLQYLYAAYSMKKRGDEGLGPQEQEDLRRWQGAIMSVAREEMAHLGSVCNLLSAVGGAPRLGRPNFPQPEKRYYPFDFRLQRFGDEALYRFVVFELPRGEPPPPPPSTRATRDADVVPDVLTFEFLGDLYGQIKKGVRAIPEDELFIGPRFAQDTDDWSNRMALHLVVDAASAEAAIDAIVLEGEGAPGTRRPSHYSTFRDIRAWLAAQAEGFEPARPVVSDPRTRPHRDAPQGGTLIINQFTRSVAELANATYITVLLLLLQYYTYGGESDGQRTAIRRALRHLMSGVVRPMAEVLTELPVAADSVDGTAGMPFELYADIRLTTQVRNRFPIVLERIDALTAQARELTEGAPRFGYLAQNLEWIGRNLRAAAAESVA